MLKADLRKAEHGVQMGRAIQRAIDLRGWSLKEFAAAVDRNERQCARWIAGKEHPQLDTIYAVESFQQSMLVALAEMAGADVEVETTIHLRRPA